MGGYMISVRQHEQQLLQAEAVRRGSKVGIKDILREAKERMLERFRGEII